MGHIFGFIWLDFIAKEKRITSYKPIDYLLGILFGSKPKSADIKQKYIWASSL